MSEPLLEVKNLRTHFFTSDGTVEAVDAISIHVDRGEVLGLVGESGCGKSITSLSILRLVPFPGKVVEGEVWFDGRNLLELPMDEMPSIRGRRIAMIFQQPQSSLNPVQRAGEQIGEAIEIHLDLSDADLQARVLDLLQQVGIPDPKRRAQAFPHELSGGMAQRVMIAMALAAGPELLIADEPTTALDVTIQAQILDLIRRLNRDLGMGVILITHDLGVVAEMADRVAVMYAGEIVEQSEVRPLFRDPKHPYTQGLIGSIPTLGTVKEELEVIPGVVPTLVDLPPGCRFASRCKSRVQFGLEICIRVKPELLPVTDGHLVRCWIYHEEDGSRKSEVGGRKTEVGSPETEADG
ncbi:MAG TPA: ABC transporter ATP-binding protein [Acidimicrobiia bacterium]|nr:ABC transporter ATP-binding protein [Acidimicrobiia bacterium]